MTGLRLLPIFLLVAASIQAQQLSLFTQYRENATLINPAAMESDFLAFGQNLSFGANYRAQWVGLNNAPTTSTIRGSYLNKDMSGVAIMAGGHIINDQTGPTGFTGLYGRIGGVLSGDPEYSGFAVGLSVGYVQFRVDASEIRLREDNDILGDQNQNQWHPDVGLGLFYYTTIGDQDYFYGGVSVPQILGLDLSFQDQNGEYFVQRVRHFYGLLGFYKFFGNDSFLEPSMWVKYAPNVPLNVDINLRYQLPGGLWIGAGGSSASTMHGEVGFLIGRDAGLDNLVKIGYGYDYSFSSFGPTVGSTHEINVSISLDR
ncbi:MAG: PorP/SprF family type IX secretion system membrane protein [Saprospiraceae bacterium]|jgi:type IX secretion system PorP/SprF family membrane protein|nr:PorP/SprF family type IX secretion system membrane protein [Saprospiraceae bacterium]